MFSRMGHALLILAVLTATGTHWFVLQSVAWTTMLAENLRTTSLSQAVAYTFDGKHPCNLCKQIAKGKQAEKKSDLRADWKKLEFSYAPAAFLFSAPSHFQELRAPGVSPLSLSHAPPVPPPRAFPG